MNHGGDADKLVDLLQDLIHLDDAAVVFCEKGHLAAVHCCEAHLSEQELYI